jgi:hypothetical protein
MMKFEKNRTEYFKLYRNKILSRVKTAINYEGNAL